MSDKRTWRIAAWTSTGILVLLYAIFVEIDVRREYEPSFYRMGYLFGMAITAFIPSWLTRVIENRIGRNNG